MKIRKNLEILAFTKIRDFEFFRRSTHKQGSREIRRGDFGLSRQIRKKVRRDVQKEFESYKKREESKEKQRHLKEYNRRYRKLSNQIKQKNGQNRLRKDSESIDIYKSAKSVKSRGKLSYFTDKSRKNSLSRFKRKRSKDERGGSLSSYIALLGKGEDIGERMGKLDQKKKRKRKGHKRHQSLKGIGVLGLGGSRRARGEEILEMKLQERRLKFASQFRAIKRKFNLS